MDINPFWIFIGLSIAGYVVPTVITWRHPRRNRIAAQIIGAIILIVGIGYGASVYSP